MFLILSLIAIGLLAGGMAGLVGVGGGVIIVPALVHFLNFSQKLAQGTTLAILIPPIGIFAAYNYYRAGHVDIKAAVYVIIGFLIGSFISSHYVASHVSDHQLSKIFAIFLIAIGIKMLLSN